MTSLDKFLNYSILESQGEIQSRREIEFLTDRSSYSELQQIVIKFVLGDNDFVYGPNCFLTFNLVYDGDLLGGNRQNDAATRQPADPLGHNVFSLLVQDLRILNDRVELEDVDRIDKIVDVTSDYCSRRYKQTIGQVAGFSDPQYFAGALGDTLTTEDIVTRFIENRSTKDGRTPLDQSVSIPMHLISNMFAKEHLLPLGLMGTGETRIEMRLKNAILSAIWVAPNNVFGYTISNMKLHLDVYTLSEPLFKEIVEVRDQQGLEFSYQVWEHVEQIDTAVVGAGAGKRTVEAFFGVKRLVKVVAFITGLANETPTNANAQRDSLSRYDFRDVVDNYLFRFGADRIPSNTTIQTPTEAYASSLMAMDMLDDCLQAPSVTLEEFISDKHAMIVNPSKDPGMVPDGATGLETGSNRRVSLEINLNNRPANKVVANDRRASGQYIINLYLGIMRNIKITKKGIIRIE